MTEERALALLKNKEPEGLGYFIDRYTPYVSAVIWNIVQPRLSRLDAEELCSDVFLALWQTAEKPHTGKTKAWLGSTARHKALSRLRRAGFDLALEEDILSLPTDGPETLAEYRERQETVRRAVEALGPPDRDIFVRHYYYGQKTTQIAKEMGLRPDNVRQRMKRGRERLRRQLTQGGILDGTSNF